MYDSLETEEHTTLKIKNCKRENSGNYSVELFNDAGSVKSNKATLTVNSMLKIFYQRENYK